MVGRNSLRVIEKGVRSCCYLTTRHLHSSPGSPAPFNWGITVVPKNKAYVMERFGKHVKTLPPGIHFLIPFVDRVAFTFVCKDHPKPTAENSNATVETDFEVKIVNPKLRNVGLTFQVMKLEKATLGEDIGSVDLNLQEKGDTKIVTFKLIRIP